MRLLPPVSLKGIRISSQESPPSGLKFLFLSDSIRSRIESQKARLLRREQGRDKSFHSDWRLNVSLGALGFL